MIRDILGLAHDEYQGYFVPSYVAEASFVTTTQSTNPCDLHFNPTGTVMYVLDRLSKLVNAYTLSTPWLVSSATAWNSYNTSTQVTGNAMSFTFSTDGTKMFIGEAPQYIEKYNLSTAWNVATATHSGQTLNLGGNAPNPSAVLFSPDGLKLATWADGNNWIVYHTLSTAWDLSTAAYTTTSAGFTCDGMFFSKDGTKFITLNGGTYLVAVYRLTTAFNIESRVALYASTNLANITDSGVSAEAQGIFFSPDGKRMYVCAENMDTIYQYKLG